MAEIPLSEYLEQISDLIEQGHYDEAVSHGRHILERYPKHLATYRLLGEAMLEAGQYEYAADMFRRVLAGDPEDLAAWVGMGEVHEHNDDLDAAIFCLERAFELAPDNEAVEEELRHLYGRRDGVEPRRVQLTPGALARLYLRGNLLSRAIAELRDLLADEPERVDLAVALAEALWRNGRRLEASETCQQILDEYPYCLKANLILGVIWADSGREGSQTHFRHAEAVDPENRMARQLFGDASPLPLKELTIEPLEYAPPAGEEPPSWMAGVAAPSVPVDVSSALEAQIELPPWLEEIVEEEEERAGLTPEVPPAPPVTEKPSPPPVEEVAGGPVAPEVEEEPEWLAGLGVEPIGEEEEEPGGPEEEEPEWLEGLGLEPIGEEAEEVAPDWLSGIREQFAAEEAAEEAPPVPAE
ncbi:MAG TPA: tetratricopeptide repeat protein, partial [Anaerolineae bacterium]|nr:tetratricopeptide repeat protein [Anaerolineae bacterium]